MLSGSIGCERRGCSYLEMSYKGEGEGRVFASQLRKETSSSKERETSKE